MAVQVDKLVGPPESERLALRKAAEHDAPFLLELLNEPSWRRFIRDHDIRSEEEAGMYIETALLAHFSQHGFGLWVVELRGSGVPAGICGLLKRPELEHVDLGFALLERHWGQGYVQEAATLVMAFAKETLGLHRIVAMTDPENERSVRTLERLGFVFRDQRDVPGIGVSRFFEKSLEE